MDPLKLLLKFDVVWILDLCSTNRYVIASKYFQENSWKLWEIDWVQNVNKIILSILEKTLGLILEDNYIFYFTKLPLKIWGWKEIKIKSQLAFEHPTRSIWILDWNFEHPFGCMKAPYEVFNCSN